MPNPGCAFSDRVPIRFLISSSGKNAQFKLEFAAPLDRNGLGLPYMRSSTCYGLAIFGICLTFLALARAVNKISPSFISPPSPP